ncbi:MAG: hypothetical protein OEM79_03380 [Nitrosopumilus sp.]|nr:hypothetical protein [Nitrosopumilus sp.]
MSQNSIRELKLNFQFSYIQQAYDELKEHKRRLGWKNEERSHQYDNCSVDVIGLDEGRARIIIRREISGHSTFVDSDFTLNLMMGFIATKVIPESEYQLGFEIQQSRDLEHRDLKNVRIASKNKDDLTLLFSEIEQKMGKPIETPKIIDPGYFEKYSELMPVVYQPAIDAWKNILREIQVDKKNDYCKITLVFEDENLRKHFVFDFIYRIFRYFRYRRTVDIESFEVRGEEFYFEDNYSGKHILFEDNIHLKAQVPIKYYFQDSNHPVIFVNTSNHALAEGDNNHDFWKREYVAWSEKVPVKFGNKSRRETEKQYKRF